MIFKDFVGLIPIEYDPELLQQWTVDNITPNIVNIQIKTIFNEVVLLFITKLN